MDMIKKIILLLTLVTNCYGFDFNSEKSIGMGGTYILSEPSAVEILSVPSSFYKQYNLSLSSGFNRSFEISDLDKMFLALAYRKGMISGAVGLSQLGNSDLYSERTVRLTTGLYYRSFAISMNYSYKYYEFGTAYEKLSGNSYGFGIGYTFQRFITAFTFDNINKPKLHDNGIKFKTKYNLFAEMVGFDTYSITGRVSWQEDLNPQIGIGQKFKLSSISSLFWGFSTVPTTYGGGVEINHKGKSIQYAVSIHPELGLSQTVSISIGFDLNSNDGEQNE
jgi:hypothetical protein